MTTAETDARHRAEQAEQEREAEAERQYRRAAAYTQGPPAARYALLYALAALMLILAVIADHRAPFLPAPLHPLAAPRTAPKGH